MVNVYTCIYICMCTVQVDLCAQTGSWPTCTCTCIMSCMCTTLLCYMCRELSWVKIYNVDDRYEANRIKGECTLYMYNVHVQCIIWHN